MSLLPKFNTEYIVMINSWEGDADNYATDFFETDSLSEAIMVYDLAKALCRNYTPNPTVADEKGFGGRGFTDANLSKLVDALRYKHGAVLDSILYEEFEPGESFDVDDAELLKEWIYNYLSPLSESYSGLDDYWRTVEDVKLVHILGAEVIK